MLIAAATAVTCVWLGMVLAISFMEAPLKFTAPGITTQLGVGIGRIVFRALNRVEMVWSALLVVFLGVAAMGQKPLPWTTTIIALIPVVCLTVQLLAIRPALRRSSNRVLAGGPTKRQPIHKAYALVEGGKALALVAGAVVLFHTLVP